MGIEPDGGFLAGVQRVSGVGLGGSTEKLSRSPKGWKDFLKRVRPEAGDKPQNRHDLRRVGCMRVLLECTCSQWSGVVNSGHGACYPTRDARRERVRGERLGEPQPPIGLANLTCYLARTSD